MPILSSVRPVSSRLLSAAPLALAATLLLSGCALTPSVRAPEGVRVLALQPSRETPPSRVALADADDVAFWQHPTVPSKNLVFAAQKLGGLSVYDTEARLLLDALPGEVRYNNVDVLPAFPWRGEKIDLAVFSDRVGDTLHAYRITEYAPYLQRLPAADPAARVFDGRPAEDTAYGLCLWRDDRDGAVYAFVTRNDTRSVHQLRLQEIDGRLALTLVREFVFTQGAPDAHAEGLVVDPLTRRLYLAQEDVGLYKVDLDRLGTAARVELGAGELWQSVDLPYLAADVEGLALLPTGPESGYLIASSQGSNSFAVYERRTLALVAVFTVDKSPTIDGSQECDGLDVTPLPWGPAFPRGVLIVHDGKDTPTRATNFKWVDVGTLLDALP